MSKFLITRILLSVRLLLAIVAPVTATIPTHREPTRTIYLVRHGFYDWDNDKDPDVGKALGG